MIAIASLFVRLLCDCFKPRQRLEAEILALRHQLNILQHRAPRRLHLRSVDRALFIWPASSKTRDRKNAVTNHQISLSISPMKRSIAQFAALC
jgi:hypothetical protein